MSDHDVRMPNSDVIERLVLAAFVLDASERVTIGDLLQADDFYPQSRRELYALLVGQPRLDLTIAREVLHNVPAKAQGILLREELDSCMRQRDWLPGAWSTEDYCMELRERTISRQLITLGSKLAASGPLGIPNGQEFNERAEKALTTILSRRDRGGRSPENISEVLDVVLADGDQPDVAPQLLSGTGLRDLDKLVQGVKRGRYYVVAGRPGMGKTALVMQLAREVSLDHRVLVFSYEMNATELMTRTLAGVTGIDSRIIERRTGTQAQRETLRSAGAALGALKLTIAQWRTRGIEELRARARLEHRKEKLGLIVVDYLQLMSARGRFNNADQMLGYVSHELKALALELNVAVMAAVAINRDATKRENPRPKMSDMRECGSIEYDANVMIGIHRADADPTVQVAPCDQGVAELIVMKQRDGETGTATVRFVKEVTVFAEINHMRLVHTS